MGRLQILHLFAETSLGCLHLCKLFLEFGILLSKACLLCFAVFVPSLEQLVRFLQILDPRLQLLVLVNLFRCIALLQANGRRRSLKASTARILSLLHELDFVNHVSFDLIEFLLKSLRFFCEPLFCLCQLFVIHGLKLAGSLQPLAGESLLTPFKLRFSTGQLLVLGI